jgi:signal peptidase II
MKTERSKGMAAFAIIFSLVFAISQTGSHLINSHLAVGETYIINSVVHLSHVQNFGGVFGSFQGHGITFAIASGVLLLCLITYVVRSKTTDFYQLICFGSILGGGVSNICDRLIYGAVIDFIDLRGIPYWNFVFNIADISIHLGLWPLILSLLFVPKPVNDIDH